VFISAPSFLFLLINLCMHVLRRKKKKGLLTSMSSTTLMIVSKIPFIPGIGIPPAALLSIPRAPLTTNFVICEDEIWDGEDGAVAGPGFPEVVFTAEIGEAADGAISNAACMPEPDSLVESRCPPKD
jgi:hypothetical protein